MHNAKRVQKSCEIMLQKSNQFCVEMVKCQMGCKTCLCQFFLLVHTPVKPETGWVKNLWSALQIFNA